MVETWEIPNFTTYVNFKLIKLVNRLSPIVNEILETFLRFNCTPIEIGQESFKEIFSSHFCNFFFFFFFLF